MTLDEIKDPTNKPRSEMVHQAIDDFISGRVFSLEMFRNRL
jgi:predicted transcriptional regulator